MSNNISSDEKIQSVYNQTKHLRSPADLDNIILGRIRALEEEPIPISSKKLGIYLPLAASILLMLLLQFRSIDKPMSQMQKPIETAQLPVEKKSSVKPSNKHRRQLPELYFLPTEDINNKVVRACTAGLVSPEERIEALNKQKKPVTKDKPSSIPIQQIYPNDPSKTSPKYDSVCRQIFKK